MIFSSFHNSPLFFLLFFSLLFFSFPFCSSRFATLLFSLAFPLSCQLFSTVSFSCHILSFTSSLITFSRYFYFLLFVNLLKYVHLSKTTLFSCHLFSSSHFFTITSFPLPIFFFSLTFAFPFQPSPSKSPDPKRLRNCYRKVNLELWKLCQQSKVKCFHPRQQFCKWKNLW